MVSSQQGLTEVMIHRVSAQVHLIVGSTGPRSQQWLYLSSKICNWNRHSQQIANPYICSLTCGVRAIMVVLASRMVRQQVSVYSKPLSLWYFAKRALGN